MNAKGLGHLKLQQKLTQNLKKQVENHEILTEEIIQYKKDQVYYHSRGFSPSNEEELFSTIIDSQIVLMGDIHTFNENIRNVNRIASVLNRNTKGLVLAVEFVHEKDQIHIDNYLKGVITELEFLDLINYRESWRFPWTHYREIFEFARKNQFAIRGINIDGTLRERDLFMAKKVMKISNENKQKSVLALIGELHITPNKIPYHIRVNQPHLKLTIIHQNIDEIYFHSQAHQFFKFNKYEYCLNTSPPWLKYESMLYWFENLMDDPDFDIHSYILETGLKISGPDIKETFVFLIKEILNGLSIQASDEKIYDFNIYDHNNIPFINEKLKKAKNKELKKFYKKLILKNEVFKLFGENSYYLPSYSPNRLVYLAGIQIQSIHIGKQKFKDYESHSKFLLYQTFKYAHSYYISKIINPYRKCDLYLDVRRKKYKKKVSLLFFEMVDSPKPPKKILDEMKLIDIFYCSKMIGYFLGEYLFEALKGKNQKQIYDTLSLYFYQKSFTQKKFLQLRDFVLSNVDYQNQGKRFF